MRENKNDTTRTNERSDSKENKPKYIAYIQTEINFEDNSERSCDSENNSVGAPHIRQRLYWVANAAVDRREQRPADNEWGAERNSTERTCRRTAFGGDADGLDDSENRNGRTESQFSSSYAAESWNQSGRSGESGRMDDAKNADRGRYCGEIIKGRRIEKIGRSDLWTDAKWIYCRDNKYRPIKHGVEPCLTKMANGVPGGMVQSGDNGEPINANETAEARVMRLKGYGNAIVPQVAAAFISAFMEIA